MGSTQYDTSIFSVLVPNSVTLSSAEISHALAELARTNGLEPGRDYDALTDTKKYSALRNSCIKVMHNNNQLFYYDLRYDPHHFIQWTTEEVHKNIFLSYQELATGKSPCRIKWLGMNKRPVVYPIDTHWDEKYASAFLQP